MLKIKKKDWENYINALAKVSDKAVKEMQDFIDKNGMENVTAVIGKSYQCSVKYGEAAMALTCEMYDKIAVVQKAKVRPAVPARDVTMQEVKDTVNHALRTAPSTVPAVTGKLVKKASSRTMRKNAARDGAKMALVPSSDGCPFCKMLGSRGWESARSNKSKTFEAHLHPHCRCEYVVDITGGMQVEGYDPEALYDEFMSLDGSSWEERMNIMRNQQRQIPAIRDKINAQKRVAYAGRLSTLGSAKTIDKGTTDTLKNERILDRILNKERVRFVSPTKVSQEEVDSILINELRGIKFRDPVVVNNRLKRAQGRTKPLVSETGREIGVAKIEIGLQDRGTKECLINTLVHENLEAKILRGYIAGEDKYWRLYRASDEERHDYIERVIKRYFRMKGWDYEKSY